MWRNYDVGQGPKPRTDRGVPAQVLSAQKDLAKIQNYRADAYATELKIHRADIFYRADTYAPELKIHRADISCTDTPRSRSSSVSSGKHRHRLLWPRRTLTAHAATPPCAATAFPRSKQSRKAWPHIDWGGPTVLRPKEYG